MIIAVVVLAVLFVAAAAGCVYFWRKSKYERQRRADETSVMLTMEKDYLRQIDTLLDAYESLQRESDDWYNEFVKANAENAKLQEKVSAVYCPTNNHVWKDGVCAKCGRAQNG